MYRRIAVNKMMTTSIISMVYELGAPSMNMAARLANKPIYGSRIQYSSRFLGDQTLLPRIPNKRAAASNIMQKATIQVMADWANWNKASGKELASTMTFGSNGERAIVIVAPRSYAASWLAWSEATWPSIRQTLDVGRFAGQYSEGTSTVILRLK